MIDFILRTNPMRVILSNAKNLKAKDGVMITIRSHEKALEILHFVQDDKI